MTAGADVQWNKTDFPSIYSLIEKEAARRSFLAAACQREGQNVRFPGSDRNPALGWWTAHRGASPVVGTAIHNGHHLRSDVEDRWRSTATSGCGKRIRSPNSSFATFPTASSSTAHVSRSISTARAKARSILGRNRPGAWTSGRSTGPTRLEISLDVHDAYYAMLDAYLRGIEEQYGAFVVLDIHSYNHRRDGPDAPAIAFETAPEINIGTFSMDRERWAQVVDPFMDELRAFEFRGRAWTCARTSPFKARANRRASFMSAFRKPAAPSQWSSRNSSWTNGQGCPTGRRWLRCAR